MGAVASRSSTLANTAAAATTTTSSGSSSTNLGLDVGLPVGLVGGLALLAVMGFLLFRYRKQLRSGTVEEKYDGPGLALD